MLASARLSCYLLSSLLDHRRLCERLILLFDMFHLVSVIKSVSLITQSLFLTHLLYTLFRPTSVTLITHDPLTSD